MSGCTPTGSRTESWRDADLQPSAYSNIADRVSYAALFGHG
jgi:hypothetical protein